MLPRRHSAIPLRAPSLPVPPVSPPPLGTPSPPVGVAVGVAVVVGTASAVGVALALGVAGRLRRVVRWFLRPAILPALWGKAGLSAAGPAFGGGAGGRARGGTVQLQEEAGISWGEVWQDCSRGHPRRQHLPVTRRAVATATARTRRGVALIRQPTLIGALSSGVGAVLKPHRLRPLTPPLPVPLVTLGERASPAPIHHDLSPLCSLDNGTVRLTGIMRESCLGQIHDVIRGGCRFS